MFAHKNKGLHGFQGKPSLVAHTAATVPGTLACSLLMQSAVKISTVHCVEQAEAAEESLDGASVS